MRRMYFLLLIIVLGCNGPKHKRNGIMSSAPVNQEHTEAVNYEYDPFIDFSLLLEEGNSNQAKEIIVKYGVNYENQHGESFFAIAIKKNSTLASYMLEEGYKMNQTDQNQLFQHVKSDTTLFTDVYLKYINEPSSILSAIIRNCDPELLKYYLVTEKPDVSKCSYGSSQKVDFNCTCIINHCERHSVAMLRIMIAAGLETSSIENECLVENWIQDYPVLSDSSLVAELLANNLIDETSEWTPLVNYCRWNKNNIVDLLLKNGYDPNWNNSSGLLYYAVTRESDGFGEQLTKEIRYETVELLLKNGANPALNIKVDDYEINFVEFANNWKFEDNTELVNLVNNYTR